MQLEKFFEQQATADPEIARQYALAGAELRVALETARQRKVRGLTQRQLADRMGVPQSVVGRFETAGRSPSFSTLCRLADGLGVRIVIEPAYQVSMQPCQEPSVCGPNSAQTAADLTDFSIALDEAAEGLPALVMNPRRVRE